MEVNINQTNDYFINRILKKYLIPTILAILGTTAVGFVNTILAGRYLGKEALTVMNTLNSFTFFFSMFGCLISIGASARAAVSMGKGYDDMAGEYETYAFVTSFIFPIIASAIILIFFRPLMSLMGVDNALYEYMKSYSMIVIGFGFLTTMMYFPFNFLRLEGRSQTAMYVFLFMGIIDVGLLIGFLNAGLGMTGVALAIVISTFVADVIGILLLLLKKDKTISPAKISVGKFLVLTALVFKTGSAAGLNNLCNMFRSMMINAFVLLNMGKETAGAFAVANALIILTQASVFGCGQTVAPLVGVFYGEHDWVSIKTLMKKTNLYAIIIHAVILVAVIPFSSYFVRLFGVTDGPAFEQAVTDVIFAALSLIPASVLNVYIYYHTVTKENGMAIILTIMRAFAMVVSLSFILFTFGFGKWYMSSFLAGELISFGIMVLLCAVKRKREPGRKGLLLLDESELEGEKYISFSVPGNKEGAVAASQKMEEFCDENDMSPKISMSLTLALEELLVVMGEHCLNNDVSKFIEVRILMYKFGTILRIRCGGEIFDPMEWYREKRENMTAEELLDDDSLGIKMIEKKAKSIIFKRTLGVNNLIVEV